MSHLTGALSRYPDLTLINAYSPLEAMMVTLWHPVRVMDGRHGPVPLGRPVAGKHVYLLDECLRVVPAGVVGEIYLGGIGLSDGYLAQPALTAERFVADPYGSAGERMYRSGDLARWSPDGVMEFAGRADDQVKLRGYRIEPGEVESAVTAHPDVAGARVVVHRATPGDDRLVAYVVPVAGVSGIEQGALRRHVRHLLPEHLNPAAYVVLNRFPVTPNGKLDHRALPAPTIAPDGDGAPRDTHEERLCALFGEVLGAEGVVGIHDDFFQMGGHSLLAIRLLNRVRTEFGADLTLATLLRSPTVAVLADRLKRV